jgi:anti-sigma B factor antagonist
MLVHGEPAQQTQGAPLSWTRQSLDDDIEVFVLRGELDMAATPRLRAEVRRLFEDGERHSVLFDLTQVTFIDSLGMGLLFAGHRLCDRSGGHVAVSCPMASVRATLVATGLTRIMPLTQTRVDAIIYLSRRAHGYDVPVEAAES